LSKFQIGDVVRVNGNYVWSIRGVGDVGTVVSLSNGRNDYVEVSFDDGSPFTNYHFYDDELDLLRPFEPETNVPVPGQYVNVKEHRHFEYWITLPGDTKSHKLTEQEAYALFRQLEDVL
jgi:hypothetical protein